MISIILTSLILVTIAMVGVILLQRHEGGVLGMGGGAKMGGIITSKSAGNLLTKITWILGTAFFTLSFLLAILVVRANKEIQNTNSISIAEEEFMKEIDTTEQVDKSEVQTIDEVAPKQTSTPKPKAK